MAKVVADLVDQVAVDGAVQAHGRARAAVLRGHDLAAVVGHSGGAVVVALADLCQSLSRSRCGRKLWGLRGQERSSLSSGLRLISAAPPVATRA